MSRPIGPGAWRELPETVDHAAARRIAQLLDTFEDGQVYVAVSGGKDSTVLLDLARRAALARGRTLDVLFIDWEAQYQATITHVAHMLAQPGLRPWWVCLPLTDCNEMSMHDLTWTAWDPAARERWVRPLPDAPGVISDPVQLPCYQPGMTFERLMPAFNRWFARERGRCAALVGLRADESIHRYRAIKSPTRRPGLNGWRWTVQVAPRAYTCYPIYDWRVEDIWTYLARTNTPYNPIYDLMWCEGVALSAMRICEPYSREARTNLSLYARFEPATWARMMTRVEGVGFNVAHAKDDLLGVDLIRPSACPTWAAYGTLLIETLPSAAQDHYGPKIRAFLTRSGGSERAWRLVCWTLLSHDYLMTKLKDTDDDQPDDAARAHAIRSRYADL